MNCMYYIYVCVSVCVLVTHTLYIAYNIIQNKELFAAFFVLLWLISLITPTFLGIVIIC